MGIIPLILKGKFSKREGIYGMLSKLKMKKEVEDVNENPTLEEDIG